MIEPWLRGTLTEFDAMRRQVLHALELAVEDVERWCAPLDNGQIHARPAGIPSVAFHLRHMGGSLDRLLTYAEDCALSPLQLQQLAQENSSEGSTRQLLDEFAQALGKAGRRIARITPARWDAETGRSAPGAEVGRISN